MRSAETRGRLSAQGGFAAGTSLRGRYRESFQRSKTHSRRPKRPGLPALRYPRAKSKCSWPGHPNHGSGAVDTVPALARNPQGTIGITSFCHKKTPGDYRRPPSRDSRVARHRASSDRQGGGGGRLVVLRFRSVRTFLHLGRSHALLEGLLRRLSLRGLACAAGGMLLEVSPVCSGGAVPCGSRL